MDKSVATDVDALGHHLRAIVFYLEYWGADDLDALDFRAW